MNGQLNIEILDKQPDEQLSKQIQDLLLRAFEGDFSDSDWDHTRGGLRFLGWSEGKIISHGAISERQIWLDEKLYLAGYVEAVAVEPNFWGRGYGTQLMALISKKALEQYEVSMLSSDEKSFYRRIGWFDFCGKSYVRVDEEEIRTSDEDSALMFLAREESRFRATKKAVCESRSGDVW